MYLYMALGDSITVGEGASSRFYAYPYLIKTQLAGRLSSPMELKIIARSGWTSSALIAALFNVEPDYIRRSKVITIWIGGDDLVKAGRTILRGKDPSVLTIMLTHYKQNLISMVRGIKQISRAKIILCTQYNPFPNSPIAVTAIQSLNQITKEVSASFHTDLAPVHTAFAGREAFLIQGYNGGRIEEVFDSAVPPIHPNNEGQRIARDVIYPRFL